MKLAFQAVITVIVEGLLKVIEIGEKLPKVGAKFKQMGDTLRGISITMRAQIKDNVEAMSGQGKAAEEAAKFQEQAANRIARKYTPTIIDNTKALEAQNKTAAKTKAVTKELAEEKVRLAEAERALREEADRYARATGQEYLRTQEQINSVLDEANTRIGNYEEGLRRAREVIKDRGLIEGTEAHQKALEELGFVLEDTAAKTETTTTTISELWKNSVGTVQDTLQTFFENGLNGTGNFYDNMLDSLKKFLAAFLAQWVASGIIGLLNGDGFSGFSIDNAFGNGSSGSGLAGIFGSRSSQQAAGRLFGDQAGQSFNNVVTGAGGAFQAYQGFNQIDQGLEQGGTSGALSVVSGLASLYQSYGTISGLISGTTAAATTAATASATAATAAVGTAGAGASAATSAATAASAAANASTAAATASSSAAAATASTQTAATASTAATGSALAATAGWIAVGVVADQALNNGRVTKAFFGEFEARKENLSKLGDGDIGGFLKGELTAGIDAVIATFAGRSFEQIAVEDMFPELFGRRDARGIDGGFGFGNNGNLGVFGNNFGNDRAGISSVQLADGGKNGNTGLFTGAQASLDAFKELAEAAGFATQEMDGFLEITSFEKSSEDIKALWAEFNDGLENAVGASEIFKTSYEANLIGPQNLLFQNLNLATGKNADQARAAILKIDESFDKLVAGGMDASQALIDSFSQAFGLTAEESVQFFEASGLSVEHWVAQMTNASGEALEALIDFNHQGVTQFEELNQAIGGAAEMLESQMGEAAHMAGESVTGLETTMQGALQTIVAGTKAANDDIVVNFEEARNKVEGSWTGLDLGRIQPIKVPSIQVPQQVAGGQNDPYLGAFNKGGRFIVPGSGDLDRRFSIDLTPGEEVTVRPKGETNTVNRSDLTTDKDALIEAIYELVDRLSDNDETMKRDKGARNAA